MSTNNDNISGLTKAMDATRTVSKPTIRVKEQNYKYLINIVNNTITTAREQIKQIESRAENR